MTHAADLGSAPTLAPGTYRIDPTRSRVGFAVKEAFGLMTCRGTFTVRDGTVVVAADPAASSATATIDAASFRTDRARRDANVVGPKFLDAAAHPVMEFTSTRLARVDGRWILDGLLTVRGVTSSVALRLVDGVATVDGCRFTATARIDRHAAGVTTARALVGRWLDVDLDVYATAVAAPY